MSQEPPGICWVSNGSWWCSCFSGLMWREDAAAKSLVIFQIAHKFGLLPYSKCYFSMELGIAPSWVLPCTGVGWEHLPATIWGQGAVIHHRVLPSSSGWTTAREKQAGAIEGEIVPLQPSLLNTLPSLKTTLCPFCGVSVSTCPAPHTVGFPRGQNIPLSV